MAGVLVPLVIAGLSVLPVRLIEPGGLGLLLWPSSALLFDIELHEAVILAPLSVAINVVYYLAIGVGVSLLAAKLTQARAWMQKHQ
jgi:hypothetical protein